MTDHIDNEHLISLVQMRPVLWDKTLEIYKDRNATKNAWNEVCCELNEAFEDMEGKAKNVFGKAVIKRWTNLRDAFCKSKRKLQYCKKSGSDASKAKKYVYYDELQFLSKLYQSRDTADSLENALNNEDEPADNEQFQPPSDVEEGTVHHNTAKHQEKHAEIVGNRKRRKPDEIELKILKALEPEEPNPHMSFFQSVMPHLSKFDDNEILEFQMGVLQVIAKINEKKKAAQHPVFPKPQPSCSNHFDSPPKHQTSFSQQPQLFCSQNNPFPDPSDQKSYIVKRESPVFQSDQSTAQHDQDFGQTGVITPDVYPANSPSPALSGSSENTYDFTN